MTISKKIVWSILASVFLTYALAAIIFVISSNIQYKKSFFHQITILSDFIGDSSLPFIKEKNKPSLEGVLSPLNSDPFIIDAIIYNKQGDVLASYQGEQKNAETFTDELFNIEYLSNHGIDYRFEGGGLYLAKTIYNSAHDVVGFTAIHTDFDYLDTIHRYQFGSAMLLIVALLLLGVPFARKLQSFLTNPISLFVKTMRDVGETQDYSIRLDRKINDELSPLAESFDHMLEKIETSNQALKDTRLQLAQSDKLASIGQLAAGVAHEINNPLGFVASNISLLSKYMGRIKKVLEQYAKFIKAIDKQASPDLALLKKELDSEIEALKLPLILDDLDPLIEDSIEGMARVGEIVVDLKTFARIDEAEIKEVNINECVELTLKIAMNELKDKCTVNKNFSELPMLQCFPGQINQVVMNLIVNAAQAIDDKGVITLTTRYDGDCIIIEIEDTGYGISPEHLEKLFDPFFTTKPVGVGTGLGLSISYGIIQKHNGRIEVESEVGKGSLFRIYLPL